MHLEYKREFVLLPTAIQFQSKALDTFRQSQFFLELPGAYWLPNKENRELPELPIFRTNSEKTTSVIVLIVGANS